MSEENKTKVRRIIEEVFNKGNLAVVDELVATDMLDHNPFPGQAPGAAGLKQIVTMFRAAFPDVQISIGNMIAEGDKVSAYVTVQGTHRGEFMGIAPTGNQVSLTAITIDRFAGGKAVEHWEQFDALGMMQQLGVIPTQG